MNEDTKDKLELGIIIVTWNNQADIEQCLSSILNQKTNLSYEILIFDNASTDNTVKIINEKFSEQVSLIESKRNLFLTGGNNVGLDYFVNQLQTPKVMVLNPDTISPDNLIEELATTIDNDEKVGAVGPKVIFRNGIDDGLLNSTGLIFDGFLQAHDRSFKEKDDGTYNKKERVFGVTGACIMFRSETLKEIGFYWEKIKLYMDEVELFIRMYKAKWKVIYNPNTYILHRYMASVGQNTSYKREHEKMKTWVYIALRHYSLKSKLAMIKKYIQFLWNSNKKQQ